jgi:AraC family transcriptional regulator
VFPYSGVYVRHVEHQQVIADANHVLFFNATETYQISHPVRGGDRNFVIQLSEEALRELAPPGMLTCSGALRFQHQHQRIDPRAQSLVALLRNRLADKSLDELAAEAMLVRLVQLSLGPRTSQEPRATGKRRRVVDRVKLLLLSNLSKRWTLGEIAAKVGGSPVYLTQLFQQVEGLPLYRYHLRLRLARALELLSQRADMTTIALELGFSSHSHFTMSFRQTYGRTPSDFKRIITC